MDDLAKSRIEKLLRKKVAKQLDNMEISPETLASYPRGRLFSDVLADLLGDDDDDREEDSEEDEMDVVDKADRGGAHDLAGRLVQHLTDALDAKRARHGFAKSEREKTVTRTLELHDIVKTSGIVAVAKAIVDENRSYGLTETEFVEFATEDAVRKFPGETADRAFTRMFTDNGADGLTLRRAHAVVRNEQLGTGHVKADRGSSAYAELMHKATEYRNAHPELSISQAFEKVYTARDNVELAKRERAESVPR
jgi:hypothetical protein